MIKRYKCVYTKPVQHFPFFLTIGAEYEYAFADLSGFCKDDRHVLLYYKDYFGINNGKECSVLFEEKLFLKYFSTLKEERRKKLEKIKNESW